MQTLCCELWREVSQSHKDLVQKRPHTRSIKNPVVNSNRAKFAVVSDPAVPAPPLLAPVVFSTRHPHPHPRNSSEEESIDLETSQNRYVFAIVSNLIFCLQSL
jgi:hypothetical protein